MKKLEYITMFSGYNPKTRYCVIRDCVSRTIQDCVVDVPSLLKMFDGRLDDLFNKYNNGLVFESSIGVFVDELNADELAKFKEFEANKKAAADKAAQDAELFELWKKDIADKVAAAREVSTPPSSTPSAE